MQNNEHGDFPVLATDKHPGKQRKSRADWRAGLLLRSSVEDNVVWHAVLIWTALTQEALSHTQRKCKSVLITWVSETERARERERNVKPCQHTSTPSDLHYRPAASFLPWSTQKHWPALIVLLLISDMFGGSSTLIRQHSFFIEVHLPVCFIVFPHSSDCSLSFWKASPTGDVSESSKLSEELLYMAGKLIGPLPNQPPSTVCFRLTADKVWQQGL